MEQNPLHNNNEKITNTDVVKDMVKFNNWWYRRKRPKLNMHYYLEPVAKELEINVDNLKKILEDYKDQKGIIATGKDKAGEYFKIEKYLFN